MSTSLLSSRTLSGAHLCRPCTVTSCIHSIFLCLGDLVSLVSPLLLCLLQSFHHLYHSFLRTDGRDLTETCQLRMECSKVSYALLIGCGSLALFPQILGEASQTTVILDSCLQVKQNSISSVRVGSLSCHGSQAGPVIGYSFSQFLLQVSAPDFTNSIIKY